MHQLTRRDLLRTAGVTSAAIGALSLRGRAAAALFGGQGHLAADAAADAAWNHDPRSPIGPSHWADIDPICGTGTRQSPIDIRTDHVEPYRGSPPMARYERSELNIKNTGHYVEVPTPAGTADTLRIDGEEYPLVQYHFHAPAEHTVNGRPADLEAHFVHRNSRGDLAAVGILFSFGCDPNPLLDAILLSAPATAGEEVRRGKASPAELLRNVSGISTTPAGAISLDSFYRYDGSLTTPGCGEGVLWTVLTGQGHVSRAAVNRFHQVIARFPNYNGYPDNNRPPQPLFGRPVKHRQGGQHAGWSCSAGTT